MESGKTKFNTSALNKIASSQPKISEPSSLINLDSFKQAKKPIINIQNKLHKQKTFMPSLNYLSPGRRKIAQLGWLGIWGGLGASLVLSLFQGFKKGFSEPISNTITLVGTALQEIADYKNSLVRMLFKTVKKLIPSLSKNQIPLS